jgi:hypothetical protein
MVPEAIDIHARDGLILPAYLRLGGACARARLCSHTAGLGRVAWLIQIIVRTCDAAQFSNRGYAGGQLRGSTGYGQSRQLGR